MEKYLRILNRLREGQPVGKEDIKYFVEYTESVDEVKLSKLREKLSSEEGLRDMTDQDMADYIDESKKALTEGQYKEITLRLAQDAEKGRLSQKVAQGLNTLLSGLDIGASLKQITESNKALKSLTPTTRPTPPGRDAYLQQAIRGAQQDTFDQERALAPAQLQLLDQYMSDLAGAKVASTGQAGVYGALAQNAANQRRRASLGLIPYADQFRRQEQSRLDELIGKRMDETQTIYENTSKFYPTELQQFNIQANRFGDLGATGRENLRTSLANFGQYGSKFAVNNALDRKYQTIYNSMLPYGKQAADTAVKARGYLEDYIGNYQPNYGTDYEQAFLG